MSATLLLHAKSQPRLCDDARVIRFVWTICWRSGRLKLCPEPDREGEESFMRFGNGLCQLLALRNLTQFKITSPILFTKLCSASQSFYARAATLLHSRRISTSTNVLQNSATHLRSHLEHAAESHQCVCCSPPRCCFSYFWLWKHTHTSAFSEHDAR